MYNCPVPWYTVVDEMSVDEMSVDELSWNRFDIVKGQVKFCLLPDFLHRFIKHFAITDGPHEISRRAACARGPRDGQHWPTDKESVGKENCFESRTFPRDISSGLFTPRKLEVGHFLVRLFSPGIFSLLSLLGLCPGHNK